MSLGTIGAVMLAGGTLSVCLGAEVAGARRSREHILDPSVVRWWHEGGWMSFAVVAAIGVVLVVVGLEMSLGTLRRNGGRSRLRMVFFPPHRERGATSLDAPALSHCVEDDLETIPDVRRAKVGLFGHYPTVELRAVLELVDRPDMEQLPRDVHEVLGRLETTVGIRPDPVQITLGFKEAGRARVVH